MNSLQALVNGWQAEWKSERAETQMTLGKLIDRLSQLDPSLEIDGIEQPHSYRGYYSDLAFEQSENKRTASEVLALAKSCIDVKFVGYKGAWFLMEQNTPVWIASYSSCGNRLISINDDGSIETAAEEEEDGEL
ncbi:MAG: hypothetical protein V4629_02925 [Pseudomonadota bacterium]